MKLNTLAHNIRPWKSFFNKQKIKNILSNIQIQLESTNNDVYPNNSNIFKAFELVNPNDINVVILGQDPYHNPNQANGLSFSVNDNIKIPSSLRNIYKNMIKYKHLDKMPTSGNLESLAKQGILFLNTSLTVEKNKPNSHKNLWKEFTNLLLKFLSKRYNLIYVLFGSHALKYYTSNIINDHNNSIIISSHPSGLSCNRKLTNPITKIKYESFNDSNVFEFINDHLTRRNKEKINWNVLN